MSYQTFFVALKNAGYAADDKEAILLHFTGKKSLRSLTAVEMDTVVKALRMQTKKIELLVTEAVKKQRAKILGLCCYQMQMHKLDSEGKPFVNSEGNHEIDWEIFNKFMVEKSYLKKLLHEYTAKELPKLVFQIEKIANEVVEKRRNNFKVLK